MTAPDRIWAKSQEWPKGSGRIEVYAAAKDDPDEPAVEYVRADIVDELAQALERITEHYAQLANSGDAGFWDCEEEPEVIAARAALARYRGGV